MHEAASQHIHSNAYNSFRINKTSDDVIPDKPYQRNPFTLVARLTTPKKKRPG